MHYAPAAADHARVGVLATAIHRAFEDRSGTVLRPAWLGLHTTPLHPHAHVTTVANQRLAEQAIAVSSVRAARPPPPTPPDWCAPPPAWSVELRRPPPVPPAAAHVPVWLPRVTVTGDTHAPVCPGWQFGSLATPTTPPERGTAGPSHGERAAATYPGVTLGDTSVRASTRERAREMAEAIHSDKSRFALRPSDPGMIDAMCCALIQDLEESAPDNTLAAEAGHWKYWTTFCSEMGTTPLRSDMAANSGIDQVGHSREVTLMAAAVPWIFARMPGRRGFDEHGRRLPALPSSVGNVIRGVRRIHKRLGVPMASMSLAMRLCETLLNRYRDEHGPEALQPHRKEPLTNPQVRAFCSLPHGLVVGSSRVDHAGLEWISLKAQYNTLAQTGFRKSEVCVPDGKPFGRRHLSRGNLAWKIGGRFERSPTPEQLHGLRVGDFAVLTVAPSKADQHGIHWGQAPVYLPFHGPSVTVNAARALRDLELAWPLSGLERRDHPLFCNASRGAVHHSQADKRFKEVLVAIGTPAADIRKYSMHSWRIYLACALLAKGASHSQIMSMLRWRSDEALRVYARMNDAEYATWLDVADSASISSIRAANLPPLLSPEQERERRELLDMALTGDVDGVPAGRRPAVDLDNVMGDISTGMRALMAAGATGDAALDE